MTEASMNTVRSLERHGRRLWSPDAKRADSRMTRFRKWVAERENIELADYHALQAWSIKHSDRFWEHLYRYFDIESPTPYEAVVRGDQMWNLKWFPGAQVNFAQHVLRGIRDEPDRAAIIAGNEAGRMRTVTRGELVRDVEAFAAYLTSIGITKGSHVAAYVINDAESITAFLACTAIGAVWSSVSPDFGTEATRDRFEQFGPQLLIATDGYVFGGKEFHRTDAVNAILGHVPSIERVVHMRSSLCAASQPAFMRPTIDWNDALTLGCKLPFSFATVAFDHPLIVCFSSGTTGKPKGIVHGHGGITLEAYKITALHGDIGTGDICNFHTTTGWMVWFMLIAALTNGVTLAVFDGNPRAEGGHALWDFVERTKTKFFSISSAFMTACMQAGDRPNDSHDLSALEKVVFGASPATPEVMEWVSENVGKGTLVNTASGGTEVFTCFVGYCPDVPSYAGEFQCTWLGVDAVSMSEDGRVLHGEVGELIIRQPLPTMPIHFLNDPDRVRLRAAYFEDFPGYWRHGDLFITLDDGTSRILGRSDATLNRGGVRIGTAEIYDVVDRDDAVEDSLVVNIEHPDGTSRMWLFLQLAAGEELTAEVRERLKGSLRKLASPRHVPDEILTVPLIPYTITGKKLEIPVKRLLMGAAPETVVNRGIMRDPTAIDAFIRIG